MKKLLPILLAIVVCACSREQPIHTESETLNAMLRQAPLQTIDLDRHAVDTVYVERFIHFRSLDLEREGVFISNVVNLDHTEDYFYVFTKKAPFIVQFDRKGNLIKKIGRDGRGPNEYGYINNVAQNDTHFYIMDGGNARINVYDHAMRYQATFSSKNIDFVHHTGGMPVARDYMLLKTTDGIKNLVSAISTDSMHQVTQTLLPRLIPPGMQPKAVNNFFAAISDNQTIALTYLGLPFIFFFDDSFKHNYTIALESEQFAGKIASLEPKPDDGLGIGVKHVISDISWITKDHLMVVNPNVISILKRKNGNYRVQGRYKLEYSDPVIARKHREHGVSIRIVDLDEHFMYLTSSFDDGVYRLPLSEIGL